MGELIIVKDGDVLSELLYNSYHPRLQPLVKWWVEVWGRLRITGAWHESSSGIHLLGRAIDIDVDPYNLDRRQSMADTCNAVWEYDPSRPGKYKCCVYGDENHLDHIHLQVHNNTLFKGA